MRKLVFINNDPEDTLFMKSLLNDRNYFSTTTYTMYGSLVLDYIEENRSQPDKLPDMIILGTNIPDHSQSEFFERFQQLSFQIEKDIKLHVLAPSIEKGYAERYPFVSSFINRPLPKNILQQITEERYVD